MPVGGVRSATLSSGIAIPDNVVDNFEDADGDPAGPYASGETVADYYSGGTGSYTRQTSTVLEASVSLETTAGFNEMVSVNNGLPEYPQKGNTLRCNIRTGGNCQVIYGAEDIDNFYMISAEQSNDKIKIFKKFGGSFSTVEETSVTVNANTEYVLEMDYASDDSHTGRLLDSGLNELATVSTTDADVSGDGVGFRGSTGAIYDHYRIV